MRKVLLISIILILLSFCIVSNAIVTNSSEYSNVKVYVFYEENNNNFEQEKQWLEENPNIRKEYINVNDNNDLFTKIKDELKIKKNKLPVSVIGSTYFIEFDEKVKNNMKEAIKTYENATDYGDIVEKIRNNEDIKDMVKKNEEIYKQPEKANIVLNLIFIIIAICVVIFILKSIKKRHKKSQSK